MLDKLLLNNQILTNKKNIQKARTQTINKLVQKLRKLKTLNEKKPNNAKTIKNLERTASIMASIKKIKTVDIIRKTLVLSKKPAHIITNGKAPPEEVAVALLASNKIILDLITLLKTVLNLDDNNPGWKDEIMELSKRKKKQLESSERKKNRKGSKSEKKTTVKKNPWKEEVIESNESAVVNGNDDIAPTKGWKVEPVDEVIEEPKTLVKQIPRAEIVKEKVPKTVVKKEVELKEMDAETIDDSPPSNKFSQKPVTTVDSFFFTETGDNYLSTVVIDRVQPEAPDDGLVRRERRDKAIRPYQRNNRRQPMQKGRLDKRQSFSSLNARPAQVTEEKLHPSWAAKQKLKPIISQFKGQKITFGENGQESTTKSSVKNFSKPNNKGKEQSQDKLHPSWEAKQKQKPAITEFKGKKITFDD